MLDFPNSPSIGQVFSDGAQSWVWDGVKWVVGGSEDSVPTIIADGTYQTSGASIASGSNVLTGVGFALTDFGKAIAVYGAGAQSILSTIAVSAGGSGYVVNELLTLAGGTASVPVVVRVIDCGLVTTGDTHASAILDNLGSLTSVEIGMRITGAGIDDNTVVKQITGPTSIVMSRNALATAAGVSISFHTGVGQLFDIDIINPGAYTVTATPLTVSSSVGGSGSSGAIFAAAFVRGPLASTITGYNSPASVTLAHNAGATVFDQPYVYGTDSTLLIQAALDDDLSAALGHGVYVHTGAIVMPDKARLTGMGVGNAQTPEGNSTILLYLGPPLNDAQVVIDTKTGAYLDGILFDGCYLASQALRISNSNYGSIGRIKTAKHTQVGVVFNVTTYNQTCSNWDVSDITVAEDEATDFGTNAHGMWIGYPNTVNMSGDPNQLRVSSLRLNCETAVGKRGVPLQCGAVDHCTINYGRFRGPENKPGFEAVGSNWPNLGHCRQMIFLNIDVGEGGYLGRGTGFNRKSGMNHFYFYDQENGSPAPVLEPGAMLRSTNHRGLETFLGLRRTRLVDLQEPTQDPNKSAYLAMLIDSPTAVVGDDVIKGEPPGTDQVLVAWTGITSVWRVIADLNDTRTQVRYVTNSVATLTATNTTAYADIPGMTYLLLAGETYVVSGTLVGTAPAAGGIAVRFVGGGALACSAVRLSATVWNGAAVVAIGSAATLTDILVAYTGAYTRITIEGVLVVTVGGTWFGRAAQNVANATATTVLANSWLSVGITS